ncbi:MAG: TRAP transporter fused permease subunit [Deltaproteobacteria bacterium]|nr:TRAP transporter fused permease subunit [Deltaproteobacteria bacterium]
MLEFKKVVRVVAGLTALYQLFIASRVLTWFGIFLPPAQHRAICLMCGLFLIYSLRTPGGNYREGKLAWYDFFPLLAGLVGVGFVVFNYEAILDYSFYGFLDTKGVVLVLLLMVSLFEASRRLTGWAFPVIVLTFVLATIFQNYLPGLLYGKGYGLDRLGYSVYVGTSGIFGTPLGVATTILITYIVFGKLMQEAGAGRFFINLALSVTGWMRGGVAKATIFASCLFGMISGSPSAEVATVGSISIPMMISAGYSARFAAAVEAVAGTGGQFMPPVMGAIAFIMAEWLGIPYAKIAIAAFIPAVLYFFVLFVAIHFEALKIGLQPVASKDIPPVAKTLKEGWYYLLPLALLIYLLIGKSYPPEMAGLYSLLSLIAVSFISFDRQRHLTPKKIWAALVDSVKTWIILAGVTATVGMLIGALELSGLGIKFSGFIVDMTQGSLLLTLIFVGVASFILGMGLDSIPAYITLAILAGPALIKLGVPPMVAHLYVIYWGLSSFFTPPVCLAVYVACGISGSKFWETGWEAVRLGISVFIIPFAFVYNRALLCEGTPLEIILAVLTAAMGGILVASASRGYFTLPLAWWQRIIVFLGGCTLIGPTTFLTTAAGIALGALGILGSKLWKQKLPDAATS